MKFRYYVVLLMVMATIACHAQETINLAGGWDFKQGDDYPVEYDDFVMLPGSMLTNDKGNPVSVRTQWTGSLYDSSYYFNPFMAPYRVEGQMKFPFFLTPKRHYVGAAWYHRRVYVPAAWKGQRLTIFLERPHIETTLYINGQKVGHETSLSVPHQYDVTDFVHAGSYNDIVIRVYNGIENVGVGQDSHSVTDQTQGNWNGIAGRIELIAQRHRLHIKSVKITPDVAQREVRLEIKLENHVKAGVLIDDYYVYAEATPINSRKNNRSMLSEERMALHNTIKLTIHMGDSMETWDEFSPVVYRLTVYAGNNKGDDVYETQFGMRDISIQGRQLILNGRPIFLRGTVENCCFPETGYPPTDINSWLKIFKKCREYGINHVRFHSYCPPEAAFSAADFCGIYLQPEGPSWPNHGVRLRRGQVIDQYLLDESKRIVDTYGHHPSFVMMAAGNEPAGDWVSYCNDWVKEMHAYDSTKIYCGASVGGGWAWDNGSEYHVKGGARGLDWDRRPPQSADDYYNQIAFPRNYKDTVPNTSPIIAHEQGQWCAFPDFKEIPQYSSCAYKAGNFEIFRDLLKQNGMEGMNEKFLMASGNLQTLCYKYEIERNLRTNDYAGFQLLSLNDYSGQGTALVGLLNVFWREKGYCDSKQWREFCRPLVPLARFPRFVFTTADTLSVPVVAYNALQANLKAVPITYTIRSADSAYCVTGEFSNREIPLGKNTELGIVRQSLAEIAAPAKLTLTVNIGNSVQNHWDFWVYPAIFSESSTGQVSSSLYITDSLDAKAIKVLRKGGKVLLTAAGHVTLGSDVKQTYLPVFWNTSWFKMRPPHTTGAYIQADHPLFKWFPTDSWSNLNWWELLNRAQVMNLMNLPKSYQPPIQPIDTWHVSRKLGMLVEARVLKGSLIITTMDIKTDLAHRHVARQMRHAILQYMESDDFNPTLELSLDDIMSFYHQQAPPVNMFTNDSPDELKPKIN